jgi:hypothetical protein
MRYLLPFLVACATDPAETSEVTWYGDVAPVVDAHCADCHTDGGVAPFTFDDVDDVAVLGPSIVASVESGSMPPWHYDADCREVAGDATLTPEEVAVFTRWREGDFEMGDPADDVPARVATAAPAPPHDLEAWPTTPMRPDTSKADDYLCQVTDLVIEEETFIAYAEVLPDRLDMVHHVITYAVPPERLRDLRRLTGEDRNAPFSCDGSPVGQLAPTVAGWVPGASTVVEPTTAAIRVPAGSVIVQEMHYNTVAATLTGDDTDSTGVRFWTIPREEVDTLLLSWSVGDYDLAIPAGATDWKERTSSLVPITGDIVATSPHMHVFGTQMDTQLTPADGEETCLTDVAYDFDWQRDYGFLEPVRVQAGDRIDLTCTFDNSADNQPVVDGVLAEPRDITFGEGSFDEMCIDFVVIAVPFDPSASPGICGGYDTCYATCAPGDAACALGCYAQVGGESCYSCGLDAVFGDCTLDTCWQTGLELFGCVERCGADAINDFHGCLLETCGEETEAYMACAQPLFEDGSCAEDYAACAGLQP